MTNQHPYSTAPRDGSWVRLFGPYAPVDGVLARWSAIALGPVGFVAAADISLPGARGAWITPEGWLAAYEFAGWLPAPGFQIEFLESPFPTAPIPTTKSPKRKPDKITR